MDIKQNLRLLIPLLAFIWLCGETTSEETTFYISPSLSRACPLYPCFTLSQFAANYTDFMTLLSDSRISLNFLPGKHNLEVIFSVANITELIMLSNSSSLPAITCQQNGSFMFAQISYVLIQNLKFAGCGGNNVNSLDHLTIENSIFLGHSDSKTALVINGTTVVIVNSSFISFTMGTYHGPIEYLRDNDEILQQCNTSLYADVGGAIVAMMSNLTLKESFFERNRAMVGGAIFCEKGTNITVVKSKFIENHGICAGGALFLQDGFIGPSKAQLTIVNSNFSKNSATYGVVAIYNHYFVSINLSTFYTNQLDRNAWLSSGVLDFRKQVNVSIVGSHFRENGGLSSIGGAMNIEYSHVDVRECEFWNNRVDNFGGVIYLSQATVIIHGCQFHNNSGFQGGVLTAYTHSFISIYDSIFTGNCVSERPNNTLARGGVMIVAFYVDVVVSRSVFINNTALDRGGVLVAEFNANLTFDNCQFLGNHATDGGTMYLSRSSLNFYGTNNLTDSYAFENGGAIFASTTSELIVYGELVFMNNAANESGGGFYLYHSRIVCQFNSSITLQNNRAVGKGGGIFASNSMVTVFSNRDSPIESFIQFENNTSQMGGGIYFALASQLEIIKSGNNYTRTLYSLRFKANSANYGGAVYVADESNSDLCASPSYMSWSIGSECFLQVLSPKSIDQELYSYVSVDFVQNTAKISGSLLYGGLLDRCTLSAAAEIKWFSNDRPDYHRGDPIDGVTYLVNISNIDDAEMCTISSKAVDICFCNSSTDSEHDCSLEPPSFEVKKGQTFIVPVVAVDQVNETKPHAMIYATLHNPSSGLGEGQMAQKTMDNCTNLMFSISSLYPTEDLILYADGPCKNASKSQKIINITFKNCTCSAGFQPNPSESKCSCICDPKLRPYITNCNSSTETVERDGNFWITYMHNASDPDDEGEYFIYPYCPLDYCLPSHMKIHINLNVDNGSDVQCANNRSGMLCGVCRPGLSVSLGSSRCISCPDHWLGNLFILIVGASFAGIGLVVFLLFLNLTVAVGTLNGIIFYANIIGANGNTFFPSLSTKINAPFVFVSWLNLEIGFDVCFFEGMDTYWKTLLQLAFPAYVFILVTLIMIVSEHSLWLSKILAKKNPVAVLATLIMLSYAKLLRIIITALSSATLDFQGGFKVMWLYDATVEYFTGKHIALFFLAILILLFGIAYTLIIFLWQWLLRLNFVTYARLCHFLEAYHAPYVTKHHYWTGLLLVIRVLLYLVFAFNTSGDPGVSLLAIIIVTGGLLFLLKGYFGQIYKNRMIDVLETTCYLNLTLFSATTLLMLQSNYYQTAVAFISVFIICLQCLIVVSYHLFTEVVLELQKKIAESRNCYGRPSREIQCVPDNNDLPNVLTQPTSTEIDGLPHTSQLPAASCDEYQEKCVTNTFENDISDDDDDDVSSVDSSIPLLAEN